MKKEIKELNPTPPNVETYILALKLVIGGINPENTNLNQLDELKILTTQLQK